MAWPLHKWRNESWWKDSQQRHLQATMQTLAGNHARSLGIWSHTPSIQNRCIHVYRYRNISTCLHRFLHVHILKFKWLGHPTGCTMSGAVMTTTPEITCPPYMIAPDIFVARAHIYTAHVCTYICLNFCTCMCIYIHVCTYMYMYARFCEAIAEVSILAACTPTNERNVYHSLALNKLSKCDPYVARRCAYMYVYLSICTFTHAYTYTHRTGDRPSPGPHPLWTSSLACLEIRQRDFKFA